MSYEDEPSDDDREISRRYQAEVYGHHICDTCGTEVESVTLVTDQGVTLEVCGVCR